jgi:hypothetical protein
MKTIKKIDYKLADNTENISAIINDLIAKINELTETVNVLNFENQELYNWKYAITTAGVQNSIS